MIALQPFDLGGERYLPVPAEAERGRAGHRLTAT